MDDVGNVVKDVGNVVSDIGNVVTDIFLNAVNNFPPL